MSAARRPAVAVRGEELHEILWTGLQWAVTKYGIECRDGTYCIEADRIGEKWDGPPVSYSWPCHMSGKNWTDDDDFFAAFVIGAALHKIMLLPGVVVSTQKRVRAARKRQEEYSANLKSYLREAGRENDRFLSIDDMFAIDKMGGEPEAIQ